MQLSETFRARGHRNVRGTHRTTLMVTKDSDLTPRGDCIVAVLSERGFPDLGSMMKEAMRNRDAQIRLILEVGGLAFEVTGRGDPRLTLSHPTDIVARKSGYVDDRTLMIHSDRAAHDIEPRFRRLLQDPKQVIDIILTVTI